MANQKQLKPLGLLQSNFAIYDGGGELWIIDLEEVKRIQAGEDLGELSFYKRAPGELKMKRLLENTDHSSDPKQLISQFWVSPKTHVFKQTAFSPTLTPPVVLNFWVTSTITPRDGDWSLIYKFLKDILCGGNHEVFTYLLNYMADMVQFPHRKPGIMIVLLGSQGTGKGTFFSLLRKLWPRTTLQVADVDHIVGNFNASLERNYVICMDEALFSGDRKKLDRLKSLITEPHCRIEQKYQPARTIDSFHRFFAASNNEQFAHVERDDRRFLFLRVADSKKCNSEYFEGIHSAMNDPSTIAAMLYDLKSRDISGFNIRNRPSTSENLNQKLQSLSGFERYWFEVLQSGCLTGRDEYHQDEWGSPRFVATHTLVSFYKGYDKQSERYATFQSRSVSTFLNRFCPSAKPARGRALNSRQVRGYDLPCLHVARSEFEKAMGGEVEWWNEEGIAAATRSILREYLVHEGAHP